MAKKLHKKKTHSLRRKKSRVKKTKRPTTQKQFLKAVPYGFAPPAWMAHPNTNTITKERFVHQWLFNGWTITSAQAWRYFGITRLADVIWKMRRGSVVKIKTIMTEGKDRFSKKVHFATYKYKSGKRKFLKQHHYKFAA